jgi:2-polyprenyl-3-methyl-5-hydroxy-6-metoxy-1,4-benzoquinol methylase
MSAHTHFLAAISSQRTECFSEHVRLLLIVNLRRMRALTTGQVKQLWMVSQNGTEEIDELVAHTKQWMGEAADLLDADLRTMRTVLRAWHPPTPEEARFYSHEADGRFSTMEALRRDTFDEWQLDKGLLRGLLRHVLPVDAVVADFGAGSGHYASWLNDTGLVTAHAFDGSPDIELVTKSAVMSADLGKPIRLWRKFDWSLCLEVAEHIPPELTERFLRNLDEHTEHGLILSWARPGLQGLGNANPRSEGEVLSYIKEYTSLQPDPVLTHNLRLASAVPYLAETLLVLVRNLQPSQGTCAPGDSTCSAGSVAKEPCGTEEGWIFAGNDEQMFPNVPDAASCCELCRSHDKCRFWTWSREDSHKELCWIKSTREYRINHDGFVSGVRPS